MEWIALIRLAVGFIFVTAAAAKVTSIRNFEHAIEGYGLVPAGVQPMLARALVVAETTIGGMLLTGWRQGDASIGAGVLLTVFAAAVGINLGRKRTLDCGCLGEALQLRMGWISVTANVLLAIALISTVGQPTIRVLSPLGADAVNASTAFVLVTTSVLLAAAYWLIAYASYVIELVEEALNATSPVEIPR